MEVQTILTNPTAYPEFQEFEEALLKEGLLSMDRGNGHWQVKTKKCVVNYYPWSSSRTIYVPPAPGVLEQALRYQNAEIATVVKLVQDLKGKEKTYANNNNAKEHSNPVREDARE
jgi:hypothetical protein